MNTASNQFIAMTIDQIKRWIAGITLFFIYRSCLVPVAHCLILYTQPMFAGVFEMDKPQGLRFKTRGKQILFLQGVFILLGWMLLLQGCLVGPNYKRPVLHLPSRYVAKTPRVNGGSSTIKKDSLIFSKQNNLPADWWTLFHSNALNALVETSLKQHPSVVAAEAALHRSLENVYAARGVLFPTIAGSFSPSTQQTAAILTSVLANNKYHYSLYTGQVFVSYTLDIFGGTRRQIESLEAQARFQALQLQATYLTLMSNVIQAAIQEASLWEQLHVTQRLVAQRKKILEITKHQALLGDASMADIAAQEAALAVTRASLPTLEKQFALQRDLLNALTGSFPAEVNRPRLRFADISMPHELPLSLPSILIEHRPDIRAAEETMRAANALVGVAVANRLPNVTIGLSNIGTTTTSMAMLFTPNTQFWSLAGVITQPIFDAGTLKHRQFAQEAAYVEAAAQYQLTVMNAFQNVADALQAIRADTEGLHIATEAKAAALKNHTITARQYALGASSFSALLMSEQLYQQAEINFIQAKANRLSDTVALFQALGGGWWNKEYINGVK